MIKRYLQFIKEQQLSLFPMEEVMKPVEEVKTYRLEDDKIEEREQDGMSDEEVAAIITHEASWRVPNLLTKRYFGETVGSIDTDKIMLTRYE